MVASSSGRTRFALYRLTSCVLLSTCTPTPSDSSTTSLFACIHHIDRVCNPVFSRQRTDMMSGVPTEMVGNVRASPLTCPGRCPIFRSSSSPRVKQLHVPGVPMAYMLPPRNSPWHEGMVRLTCRDLIAAGPECVRPEGRPRQSGTLGLWDTPCRDVCTLPQPD